MPNPSVMSYDVEEMRSTKQKIDSLGEEYTDLMSRMKTLIDELGSAWQSTTYDTFVEEYTEFQTHQDKFAEQIQIFSEFIQQVADSQEESVNERAGAASGIMSGV